MLAIWIGLLLLFGALSQNFLTARTLGTIANRIPTLAVVAAGMTLVLIIGGIDLSVGSVLGLCGAALGVAMVNWEWSLWSGAALCMGIGLAAGTLNGLVSVRLGVPSFIVTLGMLEIARGLAYLTTNSQTKYIGAGVEGLSRPIAGFGISPAWSSPPGKWCSHGRSLGATSSPSAPTSKPCGLPASTRARRRLRCSRCSACRPVSPPSSIP